MSGRGSAFRTTIGSGAKVVATMGTHADSGMSLSEPTNDSDNGHYPKQAREHPKREYNNTVSTVMGINSAAPHETKFTTSMRKVQNTAEKIPRIIRIRVGN